jgi:hypothetical protein
VPGAVHDAKRSGNTVADNHPPDAMTSGFVAFESKRATMISANVDGDKVAQSGVAAGRKDCAE